MPSDPLILRGYDAGRRVTWVGLLRSFLCLLMLLLVSSCSTVPPLIPEGVSAETLPVKLVGEEVKVDFFVPEGKARAPVVIVAHGFSRSRRYMSGWGTRLAESGFIAAIPTQPAYLNHARNGKALSELVAAIHQHQVPLPVKSDGRTALVGFSMGALTTLLAAQDQRIDLWVGLDPVDMDGSGLALARKFQVPSAILQTQPSVANFIGGRNRKWAPVMPNLELNLMVRHSTHCDVENPTDLLGSFPFGEARDQCHAVFETYTMAYLKAKMLRDAASLQVLRAAGQDDAVVVRAAGASLVP